MAKGDAFGINEASGVGAHRSSERTNARASSLPRRAIVSSLGVPMMANVRVT